MFPYDPELLDALRTLPRTIAEVVRTLLSIDAICVDGDGLKWFNWLYLQVTQAVEDRIESGGFSDGAWLAELDVQFALLYFEALAAALSGQPGPGCWRVLFTCRNLTALARIQFALALRDLAPLSCGFLDTLDGLTTVVGKALLPVV